MMLKRNALIGMLLLAFSQSALCAQILKIATLAPDSTTWMKQLRSGGDEISERTQGRVKLKFYPGGVMGNDRAVLRKIRIGQLQGGAVTSGALAEVFPDAQIYSLPLVFDTVEEVNYVRQHMDAAIAEGMLKKGLVLIGMSNGGFAYIAGNKPINNIDALKEQRVWLPEGDVVGEAMFKAAGVSPVPLPLPDVYTALQTGMLDTIISNPSSLIAFQWHTKVSHFTDAPIVFLLGALVIDKRAFDRVSAEDQVIVKEVMAGVFGRLDDLNQKDNLAAREALAANGVQFVLSTDEERTSWKKIAEKALEQMLVDGRYTQAFYDSLRKHLSAYRSQAK